MSRLANLRPGESLRRIRSGLGGNPPQRAYTFVRWDADRRGRGAIAVLQCDEFRGLDSPEDAGRCVISARDLARQFERVSA